MNGSRLRANIRIGAIAFLTLLAAACFFAEIAAPVSYAQQFRDLADAAPSAQHILGTDELGRDRLARLLGGTRVSLLLAPAAALLATLLSAIAGGVAGFAGGWARRGILAVTDLFLSLPWLFLLITVRAMLPLNVSPEASAAITFALLGSLGWAAAARVVCAGAQSIANSEFVLLARASGAGGARLLAKQILPNLKPVLFAQFWISVPVFILAEANLGMLGLGVAEPLPSWGGLLRELEGFSAFSAHWWQFAPLVLLIFTVSCFHLALQAQEASV